MKITLVADTSTDVGVFEVSVKKAIELGILKGGISSDYSIIGRFDFSLKKLRDNINNGIQELEYKRDQVPLKLLKQAYLEIKKRYDKYKYHSKTGTRGYIRFILWKRVNRQKGMKVSAQWGDIAEAYATYYINYHLGEPMTGNLENDIDTFMKIVERVDNASGLFLGDISMENGLEYAVKTAGASTLSFTQVENLAKTLSSGSVSKKILLNMKQQAIEEGKKMNTRHPIFNASRKNIEKIIKETTEDALMAKEASNMFISQQRTR